MAGGTDSIIVRIISKAGRSRLECEHDLTLTQFKNKISERLDLPSSDIGLTLDSAGHKAVIGDNKPIYSLGIKNGSEIYVHSRHGHTETVTENSSDQTSHLNLNTNTMHKSTSQVSMSSAGVTHRSSKKKKRENNETKYKTFEAYLEDINFDTSGLPLTKSYLPVKKKVGLVTPLPPTLTLKHQLYRHVDQIEVMNMPELSNFVMYWRRELEMLSQRMGYLFGYYVEDGHYGLGGTRAVVEAVYEPPQISTADDVTGLTGEESDPNLKIAEKVAQRLGLEMVGWVYTHLPREKLVTASELMKMASMQLERLHYDRHYTSYPVSTFVTMTVSAKESLGGEPGPDAFMVSDQGLAMMRDGILDKNMTSDNDSILNVRKAESNELMPTVLESAQIVDKFDCDWLLLRVNESAPKEPRSMFKRSTFHKTNRSIATLHDATTFLRSAPSGMKSWEMVADFHFLVYVGITLGVESAESLCDCILNKTEVDEGFLQVLKSLSDVSS